jgi:uncharacterized SAM-binding protein YcdF (DUF218 family)
MFIFKKIVSQFFYPLSLSLEISFLGLALLWFTRKQRTGRLLVSFGLLTLTLLSYGAISDQLLGHLENEYKPYNVNNLNQDPNYRIQFVVVLGGGHISDPTLPITSQVDDLSLVRLVEGIRVYRRHPGSRLVLSGGSAFDPIPNAELMARIAKEIGVDENDILIEAQSRDTRDEAHLIKSIVGSSPFVLVTSASHMPRAMAVFKKLDLNPIPAPTGHHVKDRQRVHPGMFFPNSIDLRKSERAFHEYLGIWWAGLRGQI